MILAFLAYACLISDLSINIKHSSFAYLFSVTVGIICKELLRPYKSVFIAHHDDQYVGNRDLKIWITDVIICPRCNLSR